MHDLNVIKQDPMVRLRKYLETFEQADSIGGRRRAIALYQKVGSLVTQSFNKDIAPCNGQPTRNMIDERLDKCVEIVLGLASKGWVSTRIIDELPRIFFDEMRGVDAVVTERKSWGVKEDQGITLDISEESNDE